MVPVETAEKGHVEISPALAAIGPPVHVPSETKHGISRCPRLQSSCPDHSRHGAPKTEGGRGGGVVEKAEDGERPGQNSATGLAVNRNSCY